MRTSEWNVAAPSRCATAGTMSASLGGAPLRLELTGDTRLTDTVVLVLRESFGTIRPFPPGPVALFRLIVTVPVFAPDCSPVGFALTVNVTVPLLRTTPDAGVTVRNGSSAFAVNAALGVRPLNVTS